MGRGFQFPSLPLWCGRLVAGDLYPFMAVPRVWLLMVFVFFLSCDNLVEFLSYSLLLEGNLCEDAGFLLWESVKTCWLGTGLRKGFGWYLASHDLLCYRFLWLPKRSSCPGWGPKPNFKTTKDNGAHWKLSQRPGHGQPHRPRCTYTACIPCPPDHNVPYIPVYWEVQVSRNHIGSAP